MEPTDLCQARRRRLFASVNHGRPIAMAPAPSTFPALLHDVVALRRDAVFLPRRRATDHRPVTFGALVADIDALATALVGLGVRRGDRVGLVAENRCEWLLVDQALASLGAVSVPRGVDTTPKELQFLLRHSGCSLAFADDDRVARELLALRGDLPALRAIIVMQDRTEVAGAQALGDLLRDGANALAARANELAAARAAVTPDDLLTIVYTSGTTAEPKGVMLTHRNVLTNVAVVTDVLDVTATDSFLSALPAWHMYERIMDYLALATGAQLVYTDRRRIKEDLAGVKPTVFAAVPRIWEMLHDGLVGHAQKLTGLQGKLLRAALTLSRAVGGGRATLGQRAAHAVLDRIVLKKVRATLGGRLRLCVSGGGALPRHVDETLLGLGLPLKNGYGLTETSPVASVRLPQQRTAGHIGPPLPQTKIEARRADGARCAVGETGVLWIHGPQVMRGYYDNPKRTAEVLTADGWFCSGDLGHVDAAGNVWITGRAKDTIVLAGGENVEPEPVEAVIKTSPLIEQAVVLGQDQKALGALLVPRAERLEQAIPRAQWDIRDGELQGREVHTLLRRELDRVLVRDNGIRPCDRVAAFRVLAQPMTAENGLLTQTMKVRRHVVVERFAALLTAMFAGGRGD
ncbi:MAG: long-chain fatty acid--CoA ligase [Planctomycetes bacterium]|nr:long-chain fatty acid--CoA ligase [Planctomycetota bacterium]